MRANEAENVCLFCVTVYYLKIIALHLALNFKAKCKAMFLDNLMKANEAENVCLLCVTVTLIKICIQYCGCSSSQFCGIKEPLSPEVIKLQ